MPWGSQAFDGRLGAIQKDLLENFGWELGEMEWKYDQVCIGRLGKLLEVRSRTDTTVVLLACRKSVRPGMRYGGNRSREVRYAVVNQLRIRCQCSLCWPQDLSLYVLFGHSFPSKKVDEARCGLFRCW